MMKAAGKYKRLLALVIGAALLITALPITLVSLKPFEARAVSNDDKQIAGDISNMTGATIDEILKLKSQGLSWNEILTKLKNNNSSKKQGDREKRSELLTSSGIGDDYADMLKKDGYTENEITEARMLVERVTFQLDEIKSGSENKTDIPKIDTNVDTKDNKDDVSLYIELAGKIDAGTAIYLAVKLKKEFGSNEKVLDEYLYALQIGIKLEDYLTDKKSYQKQRDEKSISMDQQKIITLEKIEAKMLKVTEEQNSINASKGAPSVTDNNPSAETKPGTKDNLLPEILQPEVKNVKPENPTDEINKEINAINPNKN